MIMKAERAFRLICEYQNSHHVDDIDLMEATEVLSRATLQAYSELSSAYALLRNYFVSEMDQTLNLRLVDTVRENFRRQLLYSISEKWKLLDVGCGNGRDIQYFCKFPDIIPIGIEASTGLLEVLKALQEDGLIPNNSIFEADMRDLSLFPNESFECVRNHATLHHLPLVHKGIGADQAVAESYRVLKKGGIFYTLVKKGDKLTYVDTEEGLGSRLYQLFSEDSLRSVLERNGFTISTIEIEIESRGTDRIEWLLALCIK